MITLHFKAQLYVLCESIPFLGYKIYHYHQEKKIKEMMEAALKKDKRPWQEIVCRKKILFLGKVL